MKTFKRLALTIALSTTAAMPALAYEAGDFILRSDIGTVVPNEKSEVLILDEIGDVGSLIGTSTGFTTDNSSQSALTFTYLSDTWGVETVLAPPPKHNLHAMGLEMMPWNYPNRFKRSYQCYRNCETKSVKT